MPDTISKHYMQYVEAGEYRLDDGQRVVARALDGLARALKGYAAKPEARGIGRLFRRRNGKPAPRSLYIWGDVGRGKTMLMDLFFRHAAVRLKRRVHFHAFMQEIHAVIHAFRKSQAKGLIAADADPVQAAAREVAQSAHLLCLDEFQVTDIADAMILGRLFEALLGLGVVTVATSNVAPRELYRNGLNRDAFVPFIRLIVERFDVVTLDGPVDYRLDRLSGGDTYFCPLGPGTDARVQWLWTRLTDTVTGEPVRLTVGSRRLEVGQAARGAARFTFEELCVRPLGAADYLAVARTFRVVFIERVPRLTPDKRNEARRFITLIDTLYDAGVKVVVSAEVPPQQLYTTGDGVQAFARTVSRLTEMQSAAYWERGLLVEAD